MEMDVHLAKLSAVELVATSAAASERAPCHPLLPPLLHHQHNNNNNNNNNNSTGSPSVLHGVPDAATPARAGGCCGLFGRLLRAAGSRSGRTGASSVGDYSSFGGVGGVASISGAGAGATGRRPQLRRTPQEVYFESRGKSCRKLLKFNGSSNKILLYPEEGWARTAASSYWTITPCWWQPNRCRIEEFMGATQRRSARAKMVSLEQKGSLLIAGSFGGRARCRSRDGAADGVGDEFKLYLSSNISMEDYNMGYCLTGFVERRCRQTNAFQMTHFAVIKRAWPAPDARAS